MAIRGFDFSKLGFPLRGFNGRYAADIEGILFDVRQVFGESLSAFQPDVAAYEEELRQAESDVTYKSLVLRPILVESDSGHQVQFELRNNGNTDIELIYAQAEYPLAIKHPNWSPPYTANVLDVATILARPCDRIQIRYWSHAGERFPRLIPIITRSMKNVAVVHIRCVLKQRFAKDDLNLPIQYQIFARDYDTEPETITLEQLEAEAIARGVKPFARD